MIDGDDIHLSVTAAASVHQRRTGRRVGSGYRRTRSQTGPSGRKVSGRGRRELRLGGRLEADLPDGLAATVLEVGTYRGGLHRGASLTDRQREVLRTAYDLGYYETPARASQADVAAELDRSTSTVGERLRKGEARLVAALFE